jgi:integrase/recombinase XerC
MRQSGVKNIHPHRFRDTFAVYFLREDGDIRMLSRLLGHTDVATTLKFYEHWLANDQNKTIKAMMRTFNDEKLKVIPFRQPA